MGCDIQVAARFVLGIRDGQHVQLGEGVFEHAAQVLRELSEGIVIALGETGQSRCFWCWGSCENDLEAVYETKEQRLLHPELCSCMLSGRGGGGGQRPAIMSQSRSAPMPARATATALICCPRKSLART